MPILWENFRLKLQLCLRPHLNQRSAQDVMGLQNGKGPNFENFEIFNLGILKKMTFWCNPYG